MRKEKACGAIVYRIENEIIEYLLILSRGDGSFWGFPKGHVENQESYEETAIREVLEETAIRTILDDGFKIVDKYFIADSIEKEVIIFLANAFNQQVIIQEEEVLDYSWFSYNEALEVLTYESTKNMLCEGNKFLMKKYKKN